MWGLEATKFMGIQDDLLYKNWDLAYKYQVLAMENGI
jgi:hypothetical protein